MTKEEREKILKNLTKEELEALKELFLAKISEYTNIENIKTFEELVGRQLAIKLLKDLMYELKLLKEKPFEKKKNEYL